jgi:polysaccharide biosynthesis protein PslF
LKQDSKFKKSKLIPIQLAIATDTVEANGHSPLQKIDVSYSLFKSVLELLPFLIFNSQFSISKPLMSIHIALIAGTYQPQHCGVAHYTAHLRHTLAQRGVESTVLTTHNAAQIANDATVVGAMKGWHLTDLLSLVHAIRNTSVDILHIQHAAGTYGFDRAIFLLPLLLRLTGWQQPIVTTVHEYGWWEWQPPGIPKDWLEWLKEWGQQRAWWDREDGFLLTQSNAIITTNRDAQETILRRLPQLSDRLYRIPIGANVEVAALEHQEFWRSDEWLMQLRQTVRKTYDWPDDGAIVAFFGFLHPVKGLETLLPAFQRVVEAIPQTRLLLVGGVESLALPGEQATAYWNKLDALISNLRLEHHIHMTGYLDHDAVSRCLLAADVGVLPFNHGVTLKSGSLLALMAHKLPVIATRATPPDPNLEDECLLRLINPRDVDELAAALITLLNSPQQRQALSQTGYSFSRQFAWSDIAATHYEIYQSLLSKRTV